MTRKLKVPVVKKPSYKPDKGVLYIIIRLEKISMLVREIECKLMEIEERYWK